MRRHTLLLYCRKRRASAAGTEVSGVASETNLPAPIDDVADADPEDVFADDPESEVVVRYSLNVCVIV